MVKGAGVLLLMILLFGCQTTPHRPHHQETLPAGVAFEGGDGSSIDQAVVIKGANEFSGVASEYAWIAQRFPGYEKRSQALTESGGKFYDILEITTATGETKQIFFDITDFYGKL